MEGLLVILSKDAAGETKLSERSMNTGDSNFALAEKNDMLSFLPNPLHSDLFSSVRRHPEHNRPLSFIQSHTARSPTLFRPFSFTFPPSRRHPPPP